MKIGSLLWLLPLALIALIVYVSASAIRIEQRPPEKPPAPLDANAAIFPRTIVENNGHEVVIRAKPVRIVPSDCGPADILSELVDPSRIAALPQTVDNYGAAVDFYKQNKEIA